jgi:PHD/YefM family antitoxin component YafN of YafNO toxin-antitoxin module
MSAKYKIPPIAALRVEDMPVVTATQLKSATADVFDLLARQGAVSVHRHDKPRGVLLSVEHYEALAGKDDDWLADLTKEYEAMVDEMQSPEQKAAAIRAFNATPEELGEAAVYAAQRRIASGKIVS